ncbi:hypothetical protein GE09DRAFT_1181766 [Coniochaeta sp. 2T2.1]|nr:hypothetical protein GE09DRAFT_1181766 [Coniochaeta sp. 2T2.1]
MTAAPEEGSPHIRLHITPLDPGLLPVVLSSAILPKAKNISYHELATFPEKRYGFLELPTEDAAKLRKKLNGAVLKGQKISVEEAKPQRIPEPMGDAAILAGDSVKPKKERKDKKKESNAKKRKREAEEIPGIELEDGRKVKRGWTVADDPKAYKDKEKRKKEKQAKKDKKQRRETKSKYTEHEECLVKAVLPTKVVETVTDVVDDEEDGEKKTKKRKKYRTKEVVVHEFAKTTKFPTFLKTTVSDGKAKGKGEVEFVDGKGWVDEEGNLVEPVKTKPPPPVKVATATVKAAPMAAKETAVPAKADVRPAPETKQDSDDKDASDSEASEAGDGNQNSGDDEAEAEADSEPEAEDQEDAAPAVEDSPPKKATSPPPKPISTPTSILKKDTARPTSSSSAKGLSIKIPPATPGGLRVHPLEALYKRPKQDDDTATAVAAPEAEPFSFFGAGDDMEEDTASVTLQVPLTPFSRHDFETRGIRSAAPTPDTAHPSRMAKYWPTAGADDIEEEEDDDDDDDDDEEKEGKGDVEDTKMRSGDNDEEEEDVGEEGKEGGESTSDFQKWFWEHRGDLNRSWKKRRKMAAKEKRYRENRARAERAI